jgi:hypothetical protein
MPRCKLYRLSAKEVVKPPGREEKEQNPRKDEGECDVPSHSLIGILESSQIKLF